MFSLYFLFKPAKYSSKVSFYTNYTESISPNFLNSVFGAAAGSASPSLKFSIEHFINSDRFLNGIVEQEYIIKGESITLVEYWGKDYKKIFTLNPISFLSKLNKNIMLNKELSVFNQKRFFAKEKLINSIKYSEERLLSHHEIIVTLANQELSKNIATNIYKSMVEYSNEVTNTKASEKREFIEGRIKQVKYELESSERKMIDLLQKNKDLSSPILLLEKKKELKEILLCLVSYIYLFQINLSLLKLMKKILHHLSLF